jgi:hypothetical protein
MAQSDPFSDWRDTLSKWATKAKNYIGNDPTKKVDTSWHDEMVKQANESFRKKLTPEGPKLGQKAPAKKKPTQKAAARKRQ